MSKYSVVVTMSALAALLLPAQAFAQAEIVPGRIDPPRTSLHDAALRAGHKALYLCSGHFVTGLDSEVMLRDAMLDATERAEWKQELRALVNTVNRVVQVSYADGLPPRIAAWSPQLGCAQLPIGATVDAVQYLPRLAEHSPPVLDEEPWPRGDAKAATPDKVDPALNDVVAAAFDSSVYGGVTWGVIVANRSGILAERYERGYNLHSLQRTHSAAKSLASTIVGVAVHKGMLAVDDKAGFPEWSAPGDPRAAITLDNFLRMASGLYTEGGRNPQQEVYLAGKSIDDSSLRLSVNSPPGMRYVYAGSDTNLAIRMLRDRIADDDAYLRFPFEQLLWKLGMTRTHPEIDWQGNYLMSGQAYASARDLLRLGLLYLNDGVWEGERLLPEGWVGYVSKPGPAQPRNSWADSNCKNDCIGRAYGAQFILPAKGHDLPDDAFMMVGGRGQYVLVLPSYGLVLVRRGVDLSRRALENPKDSYLTRFEFERFAADILATLKDRH